MHRIVITSGPTQEPLDPVRFLTNGSSGRMGAALASACVAQGHDVVVISGPVAIEYPQTAEIIHVRTTAEMFAATRDQFETADGLIGAAAPCDYRPRQYSETKLAKSGHDIRVDFVETVDILATLGAMKGTRWILGFALETHDHRAHAMEKLRRKHCDWIVVNDASVLGASTHPIELLDATGKLLLTTSGTKLEVATRILDALNVDR